MVTITLGQRSVAVTGAQALPSGPTRIEFRARGDAPVEGMLVALRPGRTMRDLRRAIRRTDRGPALVKRVVTFEAGGIAPRRRPYATTIDLRPATTYVAANLGDGRSGPRLRAFTVGTTPGGTVRPAPAATIGLYDYAFAAPPRLPERGVIRFEHRGQRLHIAVAFPLRRGANRTDAVHSLLRGQDRRFSRLVVTRRAFEALGPVSTGTVNDVEMDFGRRGDWLLACFIQDGEPGDPPHASLGMVKAVRVR